jgi:hypothetical protein
MAQSDKRNALGWIYIKSIRAAVITQDHTDLNKLSLGLSKPTPHPIQDQ